MTTSPGGVLLRAGLEVGDAVFGSLPSGLAYGVADLLGEAWYRFAPERRRLVAANLARVAEASGESLPGPALRRQVRTAFVAHARYYLEVVRMPRLDPARIDEVMDWEDVADIPGLARQGGIIAVSAHFGNFEPASLWLAKRGVRWIAPMERIEPPALFEYLLSRRGTRSTGGELVVPPDAARRILRGLQDGELVAIATDRDLGTPTATVTFFGHPARVPSGPASLALLTGAPVVVGTVRRTTPGRFAGRVERVEWTPTGNRETDLTALCQAITTVLERHILVAPEQWWGAFQPVWDDIRPAPAPAT
jgi:KDO2-lipid IV(A) lauroyltransferase